AHRVPRDDGTLTRPQRGVEHRVDIGGEMAEAVPAAARDPATSMTAMVERDHPEIARQLGDLAGPDPDRAGDAVREHDRIAALRPEYLGVQVSPVGGAHLGCAARR